MDSPDNERDLVESYYWFQKAAKQGDADSQFMVTDLLWDFDELRDEWLLGIIRAAQNESVDANTILYDMIFGRDMKQE